MLSTRRRPLRHNDPWLDASLIKHDAELHVDLGGLGCNELIELDLELPAGRKLAQAYSAPELLRRERFDAPVDCWSFGCLLARLAGGEELYTAQLGEALGCLLSTRPPL